MACSPFVFTRLLDFVGIYGLLLMPVGAIVFAEHWIFPRLGWTQFWASRKGLAVSWPALVAWLGTLAVAIAAWQKGLVHLFFLGPPVWFATVAVYLVLSGVAGAREALPPLPADVASPAAGSADRGPAKAVRPRSAVWTISGSVTAAALLACLVLPFWVYAGEPAEWAARLASFKAWVLAATVVYFVSGIVFMNENEKRRTG
jgi:NCS1 family nucleobase:cation symporter-1